MSTRTPSLESPDADTTAVGRSRGDRGDPGRDRRRHGARRSIEAAPDGATGSHAVRRRMARRRARLREHPHADDFSDLVRVNVDSLESAWSVDIPGVSAYGNLATVPLIADGVVYVQDLVSNVRGRPRATGQVLWVHDYGRFQIGPNGPALGYGNVYVAAGMRDIAALDATTGEEKWSTQIAATSTDGISIQPTVVDGPRARGHGAGQPPQAVRGRRPRDPVGARRRDRREGLVLRHRQEQGPLGVTRRSTRVAVRGIRRQSTSNVGSSTGARPTRRRSSAPRSSRTVRAGRG